MTNKLKLEKATKKDIPTIIRFIKELAIEEEFPDKVTVAEEDLEKNLFSPNSKANTLLGYIEGKPVCFAVYYQTFSTTTGRNGLHLDDVYVCPGHRNKGIGKEVLAYLARLALEKGYGRFEWWSLASNKPAIGFFEGLGAKKLEEIRVFRLDQSGMGDLVSKVDNE